MFCLSLDFGVPIVAGSSALPAAGPPSPGELSASTPDLTGGQVIVRVYFDSHDELNRLAAELDVWEVNNAQGYLVAQVTAAEEQALRGQGYRVESDAQKMAEWNTAQQRSRQAMLEGSQASGIPGYPCYRTVEETYAALAQLAADHPGLAEWVDIGDSWEKVTPGGLPGYDMMLIVLTNESIPGPKPKLTIIATTHAREYTTAETATRFAVHLANGYDFDADITWLLDNYEVHILPYLNPDGRKKAETGLSWRKNTDNDDGCTSSSSWGVDLNRNSSFKWNMGGSSSDPCASTYRGPSAISEPRPRLSRTTCSPFTPTSAAQAITTRPRSMLRGSLSLSISSGRMVILPWSWNEMPTAKPHAVRDSWAQVGLLPARLCGLRGLPVRCIGHDPRLCLWRAGRGRLLVRTRHRFLRVVQLL